MRRSLLSLHLALLLACCVQSCGAQAPTRPVKASGKNTVSADRAVDLVHDAVTKKHLSKIKEECISYVDPVSQGENWAVDVREKHSDTCGGDPQTSPRLFTFNVNKKTGALSTDAGSPDGSMKPLP